jgi:hypothetical protein
MTRDFIDPVKELISVYLKDVFSYRSHCLDLDNVAFHQGNELQIKVSGRWYCYDALKESLDENDFFDSRNQVYVLYSDTRCYRRICKSLGDFYDRVSFCSFYELHFAIMNSSQDIRPQKRITQKISESKIVVVLDFTKCTENVLNAIRQFTDGCLILLN